MSGNTQIVESFWVARPSTRVAPDLLGCTLVRQFPDGEPCLNSSNLKDVKDVSVNFVTYLNQIMAYSSENPIVQLKKCLTMAQDVSTHAEASRAFEQLCGIIDAENPMAAQLLEMLWQEAIMARRSALFWQQMSDVEKDMANRMMENMTQMRQNYLRLMQEM